ncbi:MAG: sugar lactone lactonase YvrE [Rhodothermales bacterium]|jgi:sugar lactone lactonase YvrE
MLVCATVVGAQAQTVSTFANLQRGAYGDGLTMSASGDLYASQGYNGSVVLMIDKQANVSVFASGLQGSVGAFFDSEGFLYVNSYSGGFIYRLDEEGTISTLAIGLNGPAGVVISPSDEVFVSEYGADFSGQGSRVKKMSTSGIASSYFTGGGLQDVIGIALDESGNLYVSNWGSGKIYKITPQKELSLFADIPGSINQIAYANGHLFVPSPSLNKVFSIDLAGTVTLIAGTGSAGSADGPALEATFNRPNSVAVNPAGDVLYILDAATGVIRKIDLQVSTGLGDAGTELPRTLGLGQAYPNPFSASTTISYSLPRAGLVSLRVFDILGREVSALVETAQEAGQHSVEFSAGDLPSGIYSYLLETGAERAAKTMFLLR